MVSAAFFSNLWEIYEAINAVTAAINSNRFNLFDKANPGSESHGSVDPCDGNQSMIEWVNEFMNE